VLRKRKEERQGEKEGKGKGKKKERGEPHFLYLGAQLIQSQMTPSKREKGLRERIERVKHLHFGEMSSLQRFVALASVSLMAVRWRPWLAGAFTWVRQRARGRQSFNKAGTFAALRWRCFFRERDRAVDSTSSVSLRLVSIPAAWPLILLELTYWFSRQGGSCTLREPSPGGLVCS
jgi:hypothetical protein